MDSSYWHKRHFSPRKTFAAKLAKKQPEYLKLSFSMFSIFSCQTSHKSYQPFSQVTTSAAWLVECFCKTKKGTKKGETVAENDLQSSGSCTPNMSQTISSRKCCFRFHYLFLALQFFSQIRKVGGLEQREAEKPS